MSLIFRLPQILTEARSEYEAWKDSEATGPHFVCRQQFFSGLYGVCEEENAQNGGAKNAALQENLMAKGDNLQFMQYLLREKNMAGRLQLIYVDPPFYSKSNYDAAVKVRSRLAENDLTVKPRAYRDSWQGGIDEYLKMLCLRFYYMKELLSEEGCLWVHLDWHAAHCVKLLLDEIFGEKQFVNEIIWNYKSGGTGKRRFSRKHDTLFFYSKSSNYYFNPLQEKSYNRGYKPYHFKGVEEYEDELGWYTLVNMKDVWQIDMVGRTSGERTGYATQKPESLLSRILESCSRLGDLCADFFGGSATLAAAAQETGRQWISCDTGDLAVSAGIKRMARKQSSFSVLHPAGEAASEQLSSEQFLQPVSKRERPACSGGLQVRCRREAGKIKIALVSCDIDFGDFSLKEKETEAVIEAARQDPLCLIDYWSVDFQYDGCCHRPRFFSEDAGTEAYCDIGEAGGKISVRGADIFGREWEAVIENQ